MKIALAQIDCEVGDLEANSEKYFKYALLAKAEECEVVIFPEMSDTGYVTSVISREAAPWPGVSFSAASQAASQNSINLICGISEREGQRIYNSLALFDNSGELRAKYRKTHLFTLPPVSEEKVCTAGNQLTIASLGEFQWGFSICYDLRFPELYRALLLRGANIFLNCAAWPAKRALHWECLSRARAIENQGYLIAVNRVGKDGDLLMAGESRVITPTGDILCQGSRDKEELLIAEVDLSLIENFRASIPAVSSRRSDLYGNLSLERLTK